MYHTDTQIFQRLHSFSESQAQAHGKGIGIGIGIEKEGGSLPDIGSARVRERRAVETEGKREGRGMCSYSVGQRKEAWDGMG